MARYSIESVQKLFNDPSQLGKASKLVRKDVNELLRDSSKRRRALVSACLSIDKLWYRWRYSNLGEDFLSCDWDNLVILDACHPKFLRQVAPYPAEDIETKMSPGSQSEEFMRATYYGRQLHDTVYVTANPYTSRIPSDTFHVVDNLIDSEWNEETKTVDPDAVVKHALTAHERYPNKRLIVHFMQPHFPFLGDIGKRIKSGFGPDLDTTSSEVPHPWFDKLWGHGVDQALLVKAYRENHEYVMPYVDDLVAGLSGKSVITADHANLLGERGFPLPIPIFGHPRGLCHPNLRRVPWVELNENGSRRLVQSDPPETHERLDDQTVEHRLESLGYV